MGGQSKQSADQLEWARKIIAAYEAGKSVTRHSKELAMRALNIKHGELLRRVPKRATFDRMAAIARADD